MKQEVIESLLSRIKDQPQKHKTLNSKTLIIDGMNTFIRAFAMDNKINKYGHHVGGIASFLKSVGYAVKNENPSRLIIIFDGEGGYITRRYLYPDYKKNRDNITTLVNKKVFETKEQETQAKVNELERLIEYLRFLPCTLLALDGLEADDVMAYITKYLYEENEDNKVCIMSSDRDFFQLVNDRVSVYSPTKKKYYFQKEVTEEFKCLPENYLIYKCFLGDTSDNVKGVHGIGEKKISTLFEDVLMEKQITFDDIYQICENPPTNSVLYERILNSKHILDVNQKIMDLSNPLLSADQQDLIIQELVTKPPPLRKYDFLSLWHLDNMDGSISEMDTWINLFAILN